MTIVNDDVVNNEVVDPTVEVIRKQQAVATRVLTALEKLNPSSIVAGGAPRDWVLGVPANDIDCYIYYNIAQPSTVERHLQRELGGDWEKLGRDHPDHKAYAKTECLIAVYQGIVDGVRVQAIVINAPTFEITSTFPVSSSKAWFKHGYVHCENEFMYCFRDMKLQVVKDTYWDEMYTNPYMVKMRERFKPVEYTYIKESDYKAWARLDRTMKRLQANIGV